MRKLFLMATAIVASLTFISCSKETDYTAAMESEQAEMVLVFSDDQSSKAFFDKTAAAESFEKSISSLTLLVFDDSRNFVLRRILTETEISEKKAVFKLPKNLAGKSCTFYAVANYDVSSVETYDNLMTKLDNDASLYNGTFQLVTTSAVRPEGFVMSGYTSKTVSAAGTSTTVSISLKRTVAKIAVQTEIDKDFGTTYGGKLTVLSTSVEKGANLTTVIAQEKSTAASLNFSSAQDVEISEEGKYNSLYYLYGNSMVENRESVVLTVNALYDIDGDDKTKDDQSLCSYKINLEGSGQGLILRNGYYRISAVISGLDGDSCNVGITVSDWETPSTQEVVLGK